MYLEAALEFAQRGWAVFPLAIGQKVPPKGSRGFLDATTNTEEVKKAWGPVAYNVGLATGARSGVFVLDIDPRHGGDKVLLALQQRWGRLPVTPTVGTGGGGYQFYFKHAAGLGSGANKIGLEFAVAKDQRGKPISGIDTRGDGGYVVAPPSLHPSGKHYAWYNGRGPAVGLAEVPDWLLEEIRRGDGGGDRVGGGVGGRPDKFRALFAEGAGEGSRNDSLTRMAGYFLRIGRLDPALVVDILWLWNLARIVPPMERSEFERTVNSVAGKETSRIRKYKKVGAA